MANGNGLSPWAYGDPETTGAAQASMMMQPAVTNYLNRLSTGQIAASGLQALGVPYDPEKSFAANALDPQRLQAAANIAMGFSGGGLSFEAWHGTRADPFPAFSNEYIGTGQGAATYGRGHYVAEAQKTGVDYRRQLAGSGVVPLDERGLPMNDSAATEKFYEPGTIVPGYGGSYDRVLDFNQNVRWPGDFNVKVNEVRPDTSNPDWNPNDMRSMLNNPDVWKDTGPVRSHATFPSAYEMLQVGNARGWQMGDPGGLVKVNVKPDKSEMLDWDLPWNNQEFDVRSKLIDKQLDPITMGLRSGSFWGDDTPLEQLDNLWDVPEEYNATGEELYHHIGNHIGEPGDILSDAGVPGHKYLDQLSRGGPQDTATHNFVIYDPKNIDIMTWNGIPMTPVEGTPPGLPDPPGDGR